MWGCAACSTKRLPLSGIIIQRMNVVRLFLNLAAVIFIDVFDWLHIADPKKKITIGDSRHFAFRAQIKEKKAFYRVLPPITRGQQHLSDL